MIKLPVFPQNKLHMHELHAENQTRQHLTISFSLAL